MDFRHMSDGIDLHHKSHHDHHWYDDEQDGHGALFSQSIDSSSHSVIDTGNNSAGNGGDGFFSGSIVDQPVALYHALNVALSGFLGGAHAYQTNMVQFDQSAIQIAGLGGNGGNGNAAIGGDVSAYGPDPGSGHGWLGSGTIASGGNLAGDGGDGYFSGSIVHASFALYNPINIAVAGYNSSADANQINNVDFDQSAFQMAGIGGSGGNDNGALGGNVGMFSSGFGSDVIATGANSAGDGGSGHFAGNLIDVSVAIYAPINIAIAGANSTAEADQINNVHFDQSAIQIAGVGGDGGHGNVALGGDFAMHLLSDLHLLG